MEKNVLFVWIIQELLLNVSALKVISIKMENVKR